MVKGTKEDGINCIIINTNIEEVEIETNRKLDTHIEIKLPR